MPEILLTFHCARRDTETVTEAIRAVSNAPIHLCEKTVRGWDFGDARTAEKVAGLLQRNALELIVAEDDLSQLLQAVTEARRTLPVRWHAVPIVARGRIE